MNSRVLVVEDEPDVRNMIVEILEADGYDVHTANTGSEAVNALTQRAYDLILTDLESSVIFVTGSTQADDYARFLTEPAGLMLQKPLAPLELGQLVRRALAMPDRPSTP
jgi:CheY-like chemotaxis protein